MVTFKSRYEGLKRDVPIKEWHENLRQRSPITADVYLRTIGLYCKVKSITPSQILEDVKTDRLRSDFQRFVRKMREAREKGGEGKAGSYIARFKSVPNSWVSYHRYDEN